MNTGITQVNSMVDDDMVVINMVNAHSDAVRKDMELKRLFPTETMSNNVKDTTSVSRGHKNNIGKELVNMLVNSLLVLSIILFVWMFISWVNVVTHNLQSGGYDLIWSWNFFKVFFGR